MKVKNKTYDCVEMKNRIQAELMREYEIHRDKYASYGEFINVTADAEPEIQAFRIAISCSIPKGSEKNQQRKIKPV